MQTIQNTSSQDLENLLKQYENPWTFHDTIMRRGLTAELDERRETKGGILPPASKALEDDISLKDDELRAAEKNNDDLKSELAGLENKLAEATTERDEARLDLSHLKRQILELVEA